jgi:glucuronate isomerase
MPAFPGEDFLLRSEPARRLYFGHAANQPIYDYHSHLDAAAIADDRRFDNLTQIWLEGDHYKWRAMRAAGVPERLITGDATDREKFGAFAGIVPQCIGNPLYHWTHMELARPLGLAGVLLGPDTADLIWERGRERLAEPACSARGILASFDVRMIGTTDDPVDTLEAHAALAREADFGVAVLPTWRADLLFKPEQPAFVGWVRALARAAGIEIGSYADLLEGLGIRLDHFAAHGCVSADHGFDKFDFCGRNGAGSGVGVGVGVGSVHREAAADAVFARRLAGQALTPDEATMLRSALAVWLGREYARRGWVMQLHIGAQRDNNSRMYARLGPASGFDSIGDSGFAEPLARFLDTLDRDGALPKTILYGLNPRDNEMLATLAGSFPGNGVAAKVQPGSAWWFNDQQDGILRQLTSVANMGLLARFVGMLTDSRSLLSFSRHDYFRRILCDLIGGWVERGEAPADYALLGGMVEDICCRNTRSFFGLDGARER